MGMREYYEDMRNEIMEAIENLALMTQREFMALRGEMGEMKEELCGEMQVMKTELHGEIHVAKDELRGEMKAIKEELRGEMLILKEDLHDEIEDLRNETRAGFAAITGIITNHEYRLERVEKKLDIT